MEKQMIYVGNKIIESVMFLFSHTWSKILLFSSFIAATFAEITPLIYIILLLCVIDLALGIGVVVKNKGWGHILSSKLRNTLFKIFFYILSIMILFLIENALVEGYYIGSKVIFAVVSGVELLSIFANLLILFPDFPIIKLMRTLLSREMASKIGLSEEELSNIIK